MLLAKSYAAAFYTVSPSQAHVTYTNVTFISNLTSSVNFTNQQDCGSTLNHTFQLFNNPVGTNTTVVNLDRTIDQVNWIPVSTNTFTTNGVYEFNTSGKWAAYRWRVSSLTTNDSILANYMSE